MAAAVGTSESFARCAPQPTVSISFTSQPPGEAGVGNEEEDTEAWRGYLACPGTTWPMSGKDRLQTSGLLQTLSSSPLDQWLSNSRL